MIESEPAGRGPWLVSTCPPDKSNPFEVGTPFDESAIMPADECDLRSVENAWEALCSRLLAERNKAGHWPGELCSSALSTATAVVALELARRNEPQSESAERWRQLVQRGVRWIASRQRDDGGWGDTDRSYSNIATTMLVESALEVAGEYLDEGERRHLRQRARRYVVGRGELEGLRRRYGRDQTFAVPILTCAALAGLVDWSDIPQLPFEMAVFPQSWYRFLRLPVVSYAIPALVAIGQVRFHHVPGWNPITRLMRLAARRRTLHVLRRVQPESGGYLEAVPLTSFVVMSLEGMKRHRDPVAIAGRRFLEQSVRADGSWPIDTNLATWNTSLAVNHLATGGFDVSRLTCRPWLLSCQVRERHPYTGAAPGGWGWSDLSGSVPDADDTPGALLALRHFYECEADAEARTGLLEAARMGVHWLLDLQNRDGGWPTFCRGWGKLPFDRSGSDLTAHVLRALRAWREVSAANRLGRAERRGLAFLARHQRDDGSWWPLWFGNQDHPDEANPVYGTAKVVVALAELEKLDTSMARLGLNWLEEHQNADGGWGGGPAVAEYAPRLGKSTVEETALAVEALAAARSRSDALPQGVRWLVDAVESGAVAEASPIGFYFARLWYYERLYPITFATAALGRVRQWWRGIKEDSTTG